jgi:hypothetical protein
MESDAIDRVLGGKYYGGDRNVVCPNCGDDYTHVIEASRRDGASVTLIECEAKQHRFEIVFRPHKGITMIEVNPLKA